MAKARMSKGGGTAFVWCPGCLHAHGYPLRGDGLLWTYNGDADRPTFTPSAIIDVDRPDGTRYRCHSTVTDGNITFCADSTHLLRGQTLELDDF